MKAVLYNPDAIDRIRRGATAADLGWDDAFYGSVCRRHELIPVCSANRPAIVETPPLVPAEPISVAQASTRLKRKTGQRRIGESTAVTPQMRDAMRNAAAVAGTSHSRFMCAALAAAEADGEFPEWRNGASATATVNANFTDAEMMHYTKLAKEHGWSLVELIRRSLQYVLSAKANGGRAE